MHVGFLVVAGVHTKINLVLTRCLEIDFRSRTRLKVESQLPILWFLTKLKPDPMGLLFVSVCLSFIVLETFHYVLI